MSARPSNGGLGLALVGTLALLAIAVATPTGCRPNGKPAPSESPRPMLTGRMPAPPP